MNVLERFRRPPEELGGQFGPAGGERVVALGDPRLGDVARRADELVRPLGRRERPQRLLTTRLLEQRAAEHEVGAPELVEVVLAAVEERDRLERLFLRELRRTAPQMHLRE